MGEEPPIAIVVKSKGREKRIILNPERIDEVISSPSISSLKRKMNNNKKGDYQRLPGWRTEPGWGSEEIVFDADKKEITGSYHGPYPVHTERVAKELMKWSKKGWDVSGVKLQRNMGFPDFWGIR